MKTAKPKLVTFEDVFEHNSKAQLNKIAEPIFRNEQQIPDLISLDEASYFVFDESKIEKFEITNNFLLEREGIRFFFNDYEIAPHVVLVHHNYLFLTINYMES